MENGLTKEENVILNMLLVKRDNYNIIKRVERKRKKETMKEIRERISKEVEEALAKKL